MKTHTIFMNQRPNIAKMLIFLQYDLRIWLNSNLYPSRILFGRYNNTGSKSYTEKQLEQQKVLKKNNKIGEITVCKIYYETIVKTTSKI